MKKVYLAGIEQQFKQRQIFLTSMLQHVSNEYIRLKLTQQHFYTHYKDNEHGCTARKDSGKLQYLSSTKPQDAVSLLLALLVPRN